MPGLLGPVGLRSAAAVALLCLIDPASPGWLRSEVTGIKLRQSQPGTLARRAGLSDVTRDALPEN